jgi:MerR family transcriptional regulator/heat shock protein HspR
MASRRDGKPADLENDRQDLFEDDQGVFMISVAAELAGMHPQTLRIYESRGLIKPQRSPKQTRLYSQRDVERLRRINELTTRAGMNLAGVERVLALEELMDAMQAQLEQMELRAEELQEEMRARIEQVHRSYRRELVPYKPPGAIVRREQTRPQRGFTIPVQRTSRKADESNR